MFNDETAQSFFLRTTRSIHAASFGAAPWERTAIFFSPPETDPVFTDQSRMRAQAAKCLFFAFFSVVFIAFFFFFLASHLFLFLNRAGVFVGNSEAIIVPPVFPFCSGSVFTMSVHSVVIVPTFPLLPLLRVLSC